MKNYLKLICILLVGIASLSKGAAQPCKSQFEFNVKNYIVYFNNTSNLVGAKYSFYWNFGDGLYSNLKSPIHAYKNKGSYRVALYISNGTCKNLYIDTVEIQTQSPGCKADFMYEIFTDTVHFYNIATGIDSNTQYNWNFGDGSSSQLQDPEHIYTRGGYLYVKLKVKNSSCIDSIEKKLYIKPARTCNAAFTYKTGNDTVYFAESTANTNIMHYWTFGDNSTSTKSNPSHVYAKNGIYKVCLQLYDTSNGYKETWCDSIKLKTIPCVKADFNYTFIGTKVQFNNLSSDNATSFYWVFDDGSDSREKSPAHRYSLGGQYKVKLFATDPKYLCSDSSVKIIQIPHGMELFTISGKVLSKGKNADNILVQLINSDSLSAMVYHIDSLYIQPADSGKYIFKNVRKGFYNLKVIPLQKSALYTKSIPRYFTGEFLWEKVTPIYIDFDFDDANIDLSSILNMDKLGAISGVVMNVSDTTTGNIKKPLPNKSLIVINQDNIPVGTSLTDSLGNFEIPLMGEGTYQIYMDVAGKKCSPLQFEISHDKLSFSRCMFWESTTQTFPDISYASGITQTLNSLACKLFPNPTQDKITITSSQIIKSIIVYNISGVAVYSMRELSSESISIDTHTLPAGIYILNMMTTQGQSYFDKFIKE